MLLCLHQALKLRHQNCVPLSVITGPVPAEICRKLGISEQTFYRWKRKYGGVGVSELRELKQLREENRRLKRMVADLSLDKQMLREVVEKKL